MELLKIHWIFFVLSKEAQLRHAAEEFCSWLDDLGDEKNPDVDSAIVRNLFSTAYDTKPSLSVPIKIVELERVSNMISEFFGVFFCWS